jgi:hypothetical protein
VDIEDHEETNHQSGCQGDRQEESIRETPIIKKTKKTGKRRTRVKVVVEAIPTDRVTRNTARVSISITVYLLV